jgi:tetrahydromethanopterin S-methyltransferase subunit F
VLGFLILSVLSSAAPAFFGWIMTEDVDDVSDPQGLITANLWFGLASALTLGCTVGLVTRSVLALAPGIVLACSLTMGIVFGITVGLAGARYIALLMCVRGRVPVRLGRFLIWCHGAGLLRVAGVAYQFRHRELQEYLAQNPEPSS